MEMESAGWEAAVLPVDMDIIIREPYLNLMGQKHFDIIPEGFRSL